MFGQMNGAHCHHMIVSRVMRAHTKRSTRRRHTAVENNKIGRNKCDISLSPNHNYDYQTVLPALAIQRFQCFLCFSVLLLFVIVAIASVVVIIYFILMLVFGLSFSNVPAQANTSLFDCNADCFAICSQNM